MQVTDAYFDGDQHLAIKVLADSFASDPDVFISRWDERPDAGNNEWHCERAASETCILHNTELASDETPFRLNIAVQCVQACSYKLRAWYFEVIDLQEASRTQLRLGAYTTQVFKYYIPADTSGAWTTSMELTVEAEGPFNPLELHLSTDGYFHLVEESPAPHLLSEGVALKFGEESPNWCVQCFVYAILNVREEGRYYVTSEARHGNEPLSATLPSEIMVNAFRQECYSYFVLKTQYDVRFDVDAYAGHADVYIAPRDKPAGPNSDRIRLRAAHGASRSIILSAVDRAALGYSTGAYHVCFYAYSPFSARVSSIEWRYMSRYEVQDGEVLTA